MSQAGALELVSREGDFSYSSHYWKNVERIVQVTGKACTKRDSEIKEIMRRQDFEVFKAFV